MTDVQTSKKRKLAEHSYIDLQGNEVEQVEQATGIHYLHIAAGSEFEYQIPGAVAGSPQTMLAAFGGRTLATNEASQVKQKHGAKADPVANIRERFDGINSGTWVDRTREGFTVNLDALTQALIDAMVADGKPAPDAIKTRQQLEADKALVKAVRSNPKVTARYAEIVGRSQSSLDELGALLA